MIQLTEEEVKEYSMHGFGLIQTVTKTPVWGESYDESTIRFDNLTKLINKILADKLSEG
jgi:hypothetical protein